MADRQVPTPTGAGIPKSVIVAIAGLVLLATGLIVGVVLHQSPAVDPVAVDSNADHDPDMERVDVVVYPDFEAGLFGLMRKDGTIIVEPIFEQCPHFSEGLAAMADPRQDRVYGYIDTKGEWKIPPRFDAEGIGFFWASGGAFHDGRALFEGENGKYGFIDRDGDVVIEPRYFDASPFSEGLAYVQEARADGSALAFDGFIHPDGKVAFHMPPSAYLIACVDEGFSEGLAAFWRNNKKGYLKKGYLDRTGRIAIHPQFDQAEPFSEGVAAVRADKHWGYIDKAGAFVIPPTFEAAGAFSESLAAVAVVDRGRGYIDKTGALVFEPVYAEALPFSGGLACVQPNDKLGTYGFVNARGKAVVSAVCEVAWPLEDGWGGCWPYGYIDETGTLVWRAQGYEHIHEDALKPSSWEASEASRSSARAISMPGVDDGQRKVQPRSSLSSDRQSAGAGSSRELRVYDTVRHDLVLYRDEFLATFSPLMAEFHKSGKSHGGQDEKELSRFLTTEFLPQVRRIHNTIVAYHPFTEPVRAMHLSLVSYAKALVAETEAMVSGAARKALSSSHMKLWQDELNRLEDRHDVRFSYVAFGDTDLHREDLDAITSLSPTVRIAIPPRHAFGFDFSEGLAVVRIDTPHEHSTRRFGYINRNGERAFPATFERAMPFCKGVAGVRRAKENLWGFIDKTGEYLIEPQFCAPPLVSDNGIMKIGLDCSAARPFGTPALVDEEGHIVPMPRFDYLDITLFSEDFASVCREVNDGHVICGFIDRFGEIRIPMQYEQAGDFSAGLAAVQIDGRWGYINKEGRLVIDARFGEVWDFSEGLAAVAVEQFSGPYGFIDRTGRFVIKPTFALARTFSDGRAMIGVETDDPDSDGYSHGFIDGRGDIVVQPQYEMARDFREGYAAVRQDGVWGFIDTAGDLVVRPQFKYVGDCCEGMAPFGLDNRLGSTRYGYIRFAE